jgi:hypothetical protein
MFLKKQIFRTSYLGRRVTMFATLICWMILKLKNIDVSLPEGVAFIFAGFFETIIYLFIIQALVR